MKTYEVWSEGDATEVTLAPVASIVEQKEKGLIGPKAQLLYRFDAATWEEAQAIHHLRMGWEPYRPAGESNLCPKCDSTVYPEGSGECWKCDAPAATEPKEFFILVRERNEGGATTIGGFPTEEKAAAFLAKLNPDRGWYIKGFAIDVAEPEWTDTHQ